MSLFGEKVKDLRQKLNLSQDELALKIGTSKQVISRYESGQRTPKITHAQIYANALDVPLLYLIDDSIPIGRIDMVSIGKETAAPKNDGLSPYDVQLMDYLRLLTDDQKRFLLAQIKTLLSTQE